MKYTQIIPFLASVGMASAASVNLTVSQDQWVGAQDDGSGGYGSNETVAEAGAGERLSLWMPGPPAAWRYNRRAYFGFDISSVNLADVVSATFTVTTASDVVGSETGRNIYYWVHADALGGDQFDETSLSYNSAITLGLNAGGSYLSGSGPYTPNESGAGTLLQPAGVALAAAGELNTITFSGAALAEMLNDLNGFVTISAYAGAPTGGGYGGAPIADAPVTTGGPGFQSKELTAGTPAMLTLELVPEPSTTALLGLGAIGLILRRNKR
ncbi:hypothetical protein NT6N_33980 [Oceaniferula spumae]|uniref:Ice-binding protein C-terminal domain-containing protein n=1 Tax=Oceaniferula spumae TaxID=2979115 RepID=A0AAT9FQV3_9BACT